MNLNPNKYSSAIVKTALYKCGLSPNLLFYDHSENKWKNYPECRAGAWNFCPVVPPRMATACTNESSSHHWSIYNWSSFPYTFPMSRAVKIIGSHSYHLTTRLSSTFCGFEMVVPKQWWFQDFPYRWATIPTVGPGLPDGSQEGEPGEQLPTLWSHHCSQKEKYEEK